MALAPDERGRLGRVRERHPLCVKSSRVYGTRSAMLAAPQA
jgi:hypothetical protein